MSKTKIVYHGSPALFNDIDLNQGGISKDFGQGFYLSDDRNHALSAGKKKAKQLGSDTVYLYSYELPAEWPNDIRKYVFTEANSDWLNYIIANRKRREVDFYDVVYGPTADAQTFNIIAAYNAGRYGDINSPETIKMVLNDLNVSRFARQVCIKSNKAKQYIKCIDMEVIHI